MKNIFFLACCLQLFIIAGCNNKDSEKKSTQEDSTKTAEVKDAVAANNCRQLKVGQAEATIKFLGQQFQIFRNATEHVQFSYDDFIGFITKNDTFPKKATDIYLEFGAYTTEDAKRYIGNHPTTPAIELSDIKDKLCVLEAYKKTDGQFAYEDKGTICPPPGSCQSVFRINKKKANRNPLNPELTTDNYTNTFDGGNSLNLTKRVKLDIACIKSWKKHFDDSCGFKAPYIYFFTGAYTSAMTAINGQESGKPCLLFAYNCAKNPDKDDPIFVFVDIGVLEFEK